MSSLIKIDKKYHQYIKDHCKWASEQGYINSPTITSFVDKALEKYIKHLCKKQIKMFKDKGFKND